MRSGYRFVVHRIAKDDRSEAEESESEEVNEGKKQLGKALPLLNGIEFVNGSANGVIKATGSATTLPPARRKSVP